MTDPIVVEPMTEEFLLWRCLHYGPLSCTTIDQWPPEAAIPWQRYRERNTALLRELTRAYGACAIVARSGDEVVGHLRFYPKAVWDMDGAGHLCLLQEPPAGPVDRFGDCEFPALEEIADKTLAVHCMMTGSSQLRENPHQRQGVGTRLVESLIDWATKSRWHRVVADAFEDLPIVYAITGDAGITFWEKLGFRMIDRHPHPHLQGHSEFAATLEAKARSARIEHERAKDRIVMGRDLV